MKVEVEAIAVADMERRVAELERICDEATILLAAVASSHSKGLRVTAAMLEKATKGAGVHIERSDDGNTLTLHYQVGEQ